MTKKEKNNQKIAAIEQHLLEAFQRRKSPEVNPGWVEPVIRFVLQHPYPPPDATSPFMLILWRFSGISAALSAVALIFAITQGISGFRDTLTDLLWEPLQTLALQFLYV